MKQPRHLDGTYAKSYKNTTREAIREIFTLKTYYTFTIGTIITSFSLTAVFLGIINPLIEDHYNQPMAIPLVVATPKTTGTIREVTMYNAGDVNQTDDSPCISANGEDICLAIAKGYKRCAANFVPLGTNLIIQNYGECKVTDRMNSRYQNRVDIAVGVDEYERAVKFGLQNLQVTIK